MNDSFAQASTHCESSKGELWQGQGRTHNDMVESFDMKSSDSNSQVSTPNSAVLSNAFGATFDCETSEWRWRAQQPPPLRDLGSRAPRMQGEHPRARPRVSERGSHDTTPLLTQCHTGVSPKYTFAYSRLKYTKVLLGYKMINTGREVY